MTKPALRLQERCGAHWGTQGSETVRLYPNLEDRKFKKKPLWHRNQLVLFVSVFPRFPMQS